LRETFGGSAVVILADTDDVAVGRLVALLATRLSVTWWRFGLPETSVSADLDVDGFRLEQPGAHLCSADLRDAPVVVYRRRLLRSRPLVVSELPMRADRDFSEREWTSLIEGLLLFEERESRAAWLNSPSAALLTHNKLALLLLAARAGLHVPAFTVSAPVRFPSSSGGELVAKAVSADERIDTTRYFSTALLSSEDRESLPGTRLPAPSLIQEYVPVELELRVFYLLGEFLALALTPSREHVDIRRAPRVELSPRVHALSRELRSALAGLANALALGYCTFDLVIGSDGSLALIDITPNGDWAYFESDSAPVVSEFVADTIVAHCAGAM
jgi:hypothetical protein